MLQNAFIFVADALRWDYLPESIREHGTVLKTVAASTITPASFSSILTGVHPPEHGVQTFFHTLSDKYELDRLDGYDTTFWEMIEVDHDPIYEVLRQCDSRQALSEVEPPFIHVERELSTHAPYDGWDDQFLERRRGGVDEYYFDGLLGSWDDLRTEYAAGVNEAASRFQDRIRTLEKRGLLEDTLVIFTSDHGELLGEYGEWSHTLPIVPELAYVPTVVASPGSRDVTADFCRHIDILPTVADALDLSVPWNTRGVSLFESAGSKAGLCQYNMPENYTPTESNVEGKQSYRYTVRSVWDREGGWAFNETSNRDRLNHARVTIPRLLRSTIPRHLPDFPRGLYHHIARTRSFGDPKFSKSEARRVIERMISNEGEEAQSKELDEDQKEQLRDLGYI